jgi:hypothetical protein
MLALYPAPVLPKRCEHKPFPRVKSSPLPTPYNTHYTIEVPALQCGTVQPNFIPNAVGSIQQHHTLACTRDKIHIVSMKQYRMETRFDIRGTVHDLQCHFAGSSFDLNLWPV